MTMTNFELEKNIIKVEINSVREVDYETLPNNKLTLKIEIL